MNWFVRIMGVCSVAGEVLVGLASGPLDEMKVRKGRSQRQSAVGADWQTAGNRQELGYLARCRPLIPRYQVRGAVEEVIHRVLGGMADGACGVVDPAYRVAVGLEPRTVTGSELTT